MAMSTGVRIAGEFVFGGIGGVIAIEGPMLMKKLSENNSAEEVTEVIAEEVTEEN